MREFYLNSDFDLTLRGSPSLLDGNDPTFVHEMANHFLFAAALGDSVILRAPLPEDFRSYLAERALDPPVTPVHPVFTPEADFTPFGWNPHALGLNRRYSRPSDHPDPDTIRKANSRAFSHDLEAEPANFLADSLTALEARMASHPSPLGWLAKGNHGHAGTANRRLPSGPLGDTERHDLDILLRENGTVVLEPWQERVQDMAVNFQVDRDGMVGEIRGHSLVNSNDGAFLGVKVSPSGQAPEPWRPHLQEAAAQVAQALKAIGYFGPVGLDAYAWRTPQGEIRFRPLVDINARLSMALPAHGLSRRLPERFILWIWAKPKKLVLPSTYAELRERLGADDFSPSSKCGILAASPLRVAGPEGFARPKRISFAMVARDEEELNRLHRHFQSVLRRP